MVTNEEKRIADEIFYRNIIKIVTEKILLSEINEIAYGVLSNYHILLPKRFVNGIIDLLDKFQSALWPKSNIAFEASAWSLAMNAMNFYRHFSKRSGPIEKGSPEIKNDYIDYSEYYKKFIDPNEQNTEREKYLAELETMDNYFLHILKSLNWFADIVRSEFDPNYFNLHGKFMNAHPGRLILENEYIYSEEEKNENTEKYKLSKMMFL